VECGLHTTPVLLCSMDAVRAGSDYLTDTTLATKVTIARSYLYCNAKNTSPFEIVLFRCNDMKIPDGRSLE
jgi:hypothetical protein